MTLSYAGRDRRLALYRGGGHSVVVDTRRMTASVLPEDTEPSGTWAEGREPDPLCAEVAEAALRAHRAPAGVQSLRASVGRGYTVPRRVSESASYVLGSERGRLSPMSLTAASMLSAGGQVSGADVLWVHRFFESNSPEEAGPVKWAAWGGADGRQWAGSLANKLEYDSVVADAGEFSVPGLPAFAEGEQDERAFWGSLVSPGVVDGLFALAADGSWLSWGNGDWVPHPGPRLRVELDDESALYAAGALLDSPDRPVDLRALDPGEWLAASASLPYLDWDALDRVTSPRVLRAAGKGDGEYTPEERSKNASSQLRDAAGRFAKVGDRGVIAGSRVPAVIKQIDSDSGKIIVQDERGEVYVLDPSDFEIGGTDKRPNPSRIREPLDLAGILGQPRASQNTPVAWMDKLLQPMGPKQIKEVIADYDAFIRAERMARAGDFPGGTGWDTGAPPPSARQYKFEQDIADNKERLQKAATDAARRIGKANDQRDKAIKRLDKQMEQARKEAERREAARRKAAGEKPGSRIGGKKVKNRPVAASAVDPEPAGAGAEVAGRLTPDNSDVAPVYMAIVDREDPRAVLDLVAMVPAGPTDNSPTTFKRSGGEWVEDPKVLQDLRSPTPPPVVKIDGDEYASVLEQVDTTPAEQPGDAPEAAEPVTAAVNHLLAAGGADRNRGNAEQLRRYWTTGKGGVKIAWNTPGDWRRCVRQLSKHLGPRAKGYCALRHREMTGMWPGDRRNQAEYSLAPGGETLSSLDDVRRAPAVIRASAQHAAAEAARAKVRGDEFIPVPPTAADIDEGRSGRAFKIPHVVVEGLSSGDKRHFRKGSLGIRNLPLPLMWQEKTAEGHDNSVIVGRIDHVERTEYGLGNAYGVLDTGPYGQEFQRLVENGMLRWVSVDLDKFEVDEELSEVDPEGKMHIRKGRMMGATGVAKPAFQECTIELLPLADEDTETVMENMQPSAISASAAIAANIPVEPPDEWLEDPRLSKPTPIQVTSDGRLFGHIATWHTSHIGMAGAQKPPRSRTGYAYFHTGVVRTAGGKDVPVGQLTLAGGHADLRADATAAVKHYDDTASAFADVHAGEDSHGIWVAGALRPGTTPEQIRAIRASAPSGDWRWIDSIGSLEMVAVCQVNVPGFPEPRALAASGASHPMALVAAGTADLLELRRAESEDPAIVAAAARSRIFLALDVDGYLSEFKTFSPEKREKLASDGLALPDGSFPIESAADLRRAVQAYGRAEESKKARVRRHIVKRARALGKESSIPKDWKEASLSDRSLANRDKYDAMVASARQQRVEALAARVKRPSDLAAEAAALSARVLDEDFSWAESVGLPDDYDPEADLNWVEDVGGLPRYIKRIAKHLQAKGKSEGHAIAIAVNASKKMCATGDLNFPGVQQVNPGSRAKACKAVAEWEAKKARAKADNK